jgi:glutathione S-transferase
MTLRLYYHPLSSFSWKALIALYEHDVPFEPAIVDPDTREAFLKVWPIGKFPVLVDEARGETVPESSAIIDYLDRTHPDRASLTPADPDLAWRTRLWDRFFDFNIHAQMQRVVGDRIRPADAKDPFGVAEALGRIDTAYGVIAGEAARRTWFSGDGTHFGLADCAAAPALYYADKVRPLGPEQAAIRNYLDRLTARPSFARVLKEAEPYFAMFPQA